ncbi:MAG TPA: tryptophanase [candidate division Zixibacteria bacterium]|nr:tryptophanase [candidate division Zixibacteria bacterium]
MIRKRQPAEPYRIKSIEPIKLLPRKERLERIARAKYNIFKLDAPDIYIDLLTDSGTGAMSVQQWAALMLGDETYAGARSFRKFEATVRKITGKKFIVPCHQGRSAENLMFSTAVKRGQYVLNNTHFDTTRGNTLHKGGIPVDLPCAAMQSDEPLPFKGNMDIEKLEEFIGVKGREQIAMVIMTITNNSVGGQPVSMANIEAASAVCHKLGIPFIFDCARFAENAYFIKRDEEGYQHKSIPEIVNEMFSYCDGAMMSAKKDGLANIGGFIAVDNEELYSKLTELLILLEGFPTYGGLAGRDLEILSVGLEEVMDYDYLNFRVDQVAYFGEKIKEAGIPIVEPTGGHAVFADAGQLLPGIPPKQYPGQALTIAFYVEGGVRAVELGSIMFGGSDPNTGEAFVAPRELVRLALPRRVYTNSHLDYIAEVCERIVARKDQLSGYKITREPVFLRHFTCDMAPLKPEMVIAE